ncbi:MAG TPA: site-2 protease family protein [Candidatus Limnocylindrales bacterium]|nr:site-2 protease family protein [Candidatus Limnocylindrales bacterium]
MIGVPVARVLGIEIRVQLGWVFVLALIGVLAVDEIQAVATDIEPALAWFLGGVVAAGFFLSSAIHDLVHAIVARRRGIAVPAIAVSFFGGATPLDPTAPAARDDLAIALAGPLASLGVAGACAILGAGAAAIGGDGRLVATILAALLVLNLLLGTVNLVPAYPLDGGRVIRALAWARSGSERTGWRTAATSGRVSGLVAVGLGFVLIALGGTWNGAMLALAGWFLILSARTIGDRVRVDELIGGLTVGDAMEPATVTVHRSLTLDTFAGQLLDGTSPMVAVPVVEDDLVVGLVGVRQVRGVRQNRWPTTRVEDVMVQPPRLVLLKPEDDLAASVAAIGRAVVDGLPVVDAGGRLVGLLTRTGLRSVVAGRLGRAGTPGRGRPDA